MVADGTGALALPWLYWDVRTGRRFRWHSPCNVGFAYEPAVANGTAAWQCYEESMSFHETDPFAWQPGRKPVQLGRFGLGSELNLHGDGSLLVFNSNRVTNRGVVDAKLWRIVNLQRELLFEGPDARPIVDVDQGRIAIRRGARIDIRDAYARLVHRVGIGAGPAEVVLTGNQLVVLRDRTLQIYDVRSGRRVRRWNLRTGGLAKPALIDAEGDVAVYIAGIAIHLVHLTDGKDLALTINNQQGPASADIEPKGLFYSYNQAYSRRPGHIAFITMQALSRRLDQAATPTTAMVLGARSIERGFST